jgi:3-isopropylmalate/(R)-2-methylmalate dehydratase small subunit
VGWGIRVVISTSFADIFCNNALKNGLIPIVVEPDMHQKIVEMIEEVPDGELHVDLDTQRVFLPDGSFFEFPIDPFAKTCLINGVDQMGYIQSFEDKISAFETQRGITIIN